MVKLVAKKTEFLSCFFFFFLISHTLIVITCREDALFFIFFLISAVQRTQGRYTSSRGDVGLRLLLAGVERSLGLLGFGEVLELGV